MVAPACSSPADSAECTMLMVEATATNSHRAGRVTRFYKHEWLAVVENGNTRPQAARRAQHRLLRHTSK